MWMIKVLHSPLTIEQQKHTLFITKLKSDSMSVNIKGLFKKKVPPTLPYPPSNRAKITY